MATAFRLELLLRLQRRELKLAQHELARAEQELADRLEDLALLLATEEQAIVALERSLSHPAVETARVRTRRDELLAIHDMVGEAEQTVKALRAQMEARREDVILAQRRTRSMQRLKERPLEGEVVYGLQISRPGRR